MNQFNNLVQWKNLTDEEKAGFDFVDYKYEVQRLTNGVDFYSSIVSMNGEANSEKVYRLVIEPDKWYAMPDPDGLYVYKDILKGSDIKSPEKYTNLRPARPDEIPQPEKTLEQKIQDKWPDKKVVMLESNKGILRINRFIEGCEFDYPHIFAQSMRGFFFYVYQIPQDGSFFLDTKAAYCWNEGTTLQPVAVLFEGEE